MAARPRDDAFGNVGGVGAVVKPHVRPDPPSLKQVRVRDTLVPLVDQRATE